MLARQEPHTAAGGCCSGLVRGWYTVPKRTVMSPGETRVSHASPACRIGEVVGSGLTNENGPPTVANGPFSLYTMRGHITSRKAGRKSPQRTRAEEAKPGGTGSGRQYPPEDTNCRVSLTVRPARERDQGSAVANRPLGESVFPAQHHSWFRSQIRSAPVTGRSAPAAPVW
jgi:hypothetical protein